MLLKRFQPLRHRRNIRLFGTILSEDELKNSQWQLLYQENKITRIGLITLWGTMTCTTFGFFQFTHVPVAEDAAMMLKFFGSGVWNFVGVGLGVGSLYGNYAYSKTCVSEMFARDEKEVGIRKHTVIGTTSTKATLHKVSDIARVDNGTLSNIVCRCKVTGERFIFDKHPEVDRLFPVVTKSNNIPIVARNQTPLPSNVGGSSVDDTKKFEEAISSKEEVKGEIQKKWSKGKRNKI
jgi:hypothetical protein